jgi:DNA-binding transcriptional LysR family regulator
MNVDFELYKVFYVVAKNEHMSKAANELFISQPAVSQAIKKLEDQLGGTLFLRSNKGIQLTEEGKMFYEYVKGAVELIENAEHEFSNFKDLNTGEVKIGISTSITKLVLIKPLEVFHKEYPNIIINVINGLTSDLIFDLQKGKLDFVILNEGDTHETNVNLKPIRKIRHSFIYNRNYFQFDDKTFTFNDLNDYPLILQKKESNSRKFLDSITLKYGINLKPKLEAVSQELVNEFVNIGLGIGFTITDLVKDKNYKDIVQLSLANNIPVSQIFLATNKSILPTFAANKFIEYLIKLNL